MAKTQSTAREGTRQTARRTSRPKTDSSATLVAASDSPTPPKQKAPTKGDMLVALLRRPGGITAAQMAEATGWKIHTARAFISVRKKLGIAIRAEKGDGGNTVYRIIDEAAA